DGIQGTRLLPVPARRLTRGVSPQRPLLPPPGRADRPLVRAGDGRPALRRGRQAQRGPRGVLQAPARHVLRRPSLRAATHEGGRRPALLEVVPWLRSVRRRAPDGL
ncbi:MAG: hypothetical protein AVDCRST_MAG01-01-1817, partial [uncultured Rubrobacteraceae bacterium]